MVYRVVNPEMSRAMYDRRMRQKTRNSARPTQKDIAAAAGVSQAAVSMVLNKSETPSVPAATRDRILKVAGELAYQPSHPARTLRSARTMTLACIVPDITNPFYPGLVRGLQTTAAPAGYDVLIYDTDGALDGERRAISWLQQGRADGVVGTFFHLRAPDLAVVARNRVPIVRLEGQGKSRGALPIDSVFIDNARAAAMMTRLLIGRGHRRIAMILGEFGPGKQRALGYETVMREAGLATEFVTDTTYSEEAGARAMQLLLASGRQRPTAVFGANDMLAIGAMQAARSAGLAIPKDVAIVGFDDIPTAKLLGLTTVRQPEFELGALAARTLIERLQPGGLKPPGRSLELKFEIVERSSV
jgi:LacI family transcriptional regulator